jgi:hypothetical protein
VRVTASKLNRRTPKRVAIQFVKLRGAVSTATDQIGRWRMDVCPQVTGLTPVAGAFVSRRVKAVARSAGAPTGQVGKRCEVNVEIVFTPEPQPLLKHIAKAYPMLLGSSQSAGDTTFRHAIQSWHLTGAKAEVGLKVSPFMEYWLGAGQDAVNGPPLPDGAGVDPAYVKAFAAGDSGGSHLSTALSSELVHVLVIVDARKVAGDSLRSIADYIAMLALTRMGSLDACSEPPSIIDLLSSSCDARDKPRALTDADTAYLKALYSSDLEMNVNIELSDMRDRMVKVIMGR